ncbi:right-handed parallel beta-helix repeat-containing protein [Arthrobacter sp. CP30]
MTLVRPLIHRSLVLSLGLALVAVGLSPSTAAEAAQAPCSRTVVLGQDIAAAVQRAPDYAVICLASGVHEVTKTIVPRTGQVIRGSGAVLSGAEPLDNLAKINGRLEAKGVLPPRYSGNGQCEDAASSLCNQAEILFRDNVALKAVGRLRDLGPDSYFADYSANMLYVGNGDAEASYTLARTRTAIESRASGVTLDGLIIRGFANLPQSGAVMVSGQGWAVRDCLITDNHAIGLMIARGENALIEGNRISRNGQLGIGQWRSNNARVIDNVVSYNNTRGFWVADWESGGMKVTYSSSLIEGNTFRGNRGVGVWADVGADGVTIRNNTIASNLADGVRYEISRNGQILGNTVTDNGLNKGRGSGLGLMSGAGINVNTSAGVAVQGNVVRGNLNGIGVQLRPRGSGPLGPYRLQDVKVTDNVIDVRSPGTAVSGIVRASSYVGSVADARIAFSGNTYVVNALQDRKLFLDQSPMSFDQWKGRGFDVRGKVGLVLPSALPTTPTAPSPAPAPVSGSATTIALDSFARNGAGLGDAEKGGTWSVSGGDYYYRTKAGAGVWSMKKPGSAPSAYLNDLMVHGSQTSLEFAPAAKLEEGGVYVSVVGRAVPNAGEYRVKVRAAPIGTSLSIMKADASGVEKPLSEEIQVEGATATPDGKLAVRVLVHPSSGGKTLIQARLWKVGAREGTTWQVEATDSAAELQAPGSVGLITVLSSRASVPMDLLVDNWKTQTLQ